MDKFHLGQNELQAMIDARGFKPENIICTIRSQGIEISAEYADKRFDFNGMQRMNKTYIVPFAISPERSNCVLSSDGVLFISACWKK